MDFNNFVEKNDFINIIRRLESEVEELKEKLENAKDEEELKEDKKKDEELNKRFSNLDTLMERLKKIDSNLAYFAINGNYKTFFDWRVRPALDIIGFLTSAANNMATTANHYSNNMYAKKHEVKKALKISNRMLDEIEKGLDLFDAEFECLLGKKNMFKS